MTHDLLDATVLRLESKDETDQLSFITPILSFRLLASLASTLHLLSARTNPHPLILRSDHPTVFLAGADLREIADLDTDSCVVYAEHGRSIVNLLETFPAPTVAATEGSCSGGGFDIAMACDAIVAGPRASFEHPGVRRGLVTGWAGTVLMPAALGPSVARALLIKGHRLESETASSLGLVSQVSPDPCRTAVEKALELARLHPSRRAVWRQLRGSQFVDRFRASVIHKL